MPTLVWKGDTLYSSYVHGRVDDFGPGFTGFVIGLVVAAVAEVLVFLALVLYALTLWHNDSSDRAHGSFCR